MKFIFVVSTSRNSQLLLLYLLHRRLKTVNSMVKALQIKNEAVTNTSSQRAFIKMKLFKMQKKHCKTRRPQKRINVELLFDEEKTSANASYSITYIESRKLTSAKLCCADEIVSTWFPNICTERQLA